MAERVERACPQCGAKLIGREAYEQKCRTCRQEEYFETERLERRWRRNRVMWALAIVTLLCAITAGGLVF